MKTNLREKILGLMFSTALLIGFVPTSLVGTSGCGFLCDDDDCVIGTPDDNSSQQTGSVTQSDVVERLLSELCGAAVRCDMAGVAGCSGTS